MHGISWTSEDRGNGRYKTTVVEDVTMKLDEYCGQLECNTEN